MAQAFKLITVCLKLSLKKNCWIAEKIYGRSPKHCVLEIAVNLHWLSGYSLDETLSYNEDLCMTGPLNS